ncbi:MAG TPA: 2-C-methyl-D-erythritol 4-phosphate cytidylyltransferase [Phycisphaerales bacterium]|nr:2-C-methyl-D-erythritol 4-phosphate cytidylyltransferase [Phycisphaerales bacterium]HMP35841.1 2-C-methyl-D-erythritol 4-phosphate cytidylyltransferase [Phycisphaerales bacterium]
MNISVIIPAAGSSRRFGSDKLGQDLGGRALLLRTVELFTKRDEVRSIVVAAPPDSFEEFRDRYGAPLGFHGVQLVPGGRRERWETVQAALAAVPDDATHIAIHDAARPAAPPELLDRVFEAARRFAAVVPAVAIQATVKRVGAEAESAVEEDPIADLILGEAASEHRATARRVEATIDRTGLVAVQTPQVFAAALLRRAYAAAPLEGATDDAQVVERLGEPVHVVEGDGRNVKVTTPADLELVRAILRLPAPTERPVHKRF